MIALAFAAAVTAMLLYSTASLMQAVATRRASGPAVLRHPYYLAGLGLDGLAWALSLVALVRLPVFVVQSVLAGSVAVTILLAWRLLGTPLRRLDVVSIALVLAGLVGIALTAGPESSAHPSTTIVWGLTVAVGVVAAVSLATYRIRSMPLHAVLGGLGFGGAALCGRAVAVTCSSVGDVVRSPAAWAVLVAGVVGAAMYARALESNRVGPATAIMWVVEVVVPGIAGIVWLDDAVRAGWFPAAAVSLAAAVVGCVLASLAEAA